jgi:3'(2'), 5'-bisphosphate nucleotidase
MINNETLRTNLLAICQKTSVAILEIYGQPFEVVQKADNSPVTAADLAANKIILAELQQLYPAIPYLSEEVKQTTYTERRNWPLFWLIDPIDGTKEFIQRNGDFTVNIALIENSIPIAGIVYIPVSGIAYFGAKGAGAQKFENNEWTRIENTTHYTAKQVITVVGSKSHLTEHTLAFVQQLRDQGKEVTFSSRGSSLKLCMVAEGAADVYPRFGPTMEWDTAAAHAVALYAGRQVLNAETRQPLLYNKENLLNPWFIVE